MKMDTLNLMKKKSFKGKVIFGMENDKEIVIENLNDMPFLDTTLLNYLENKEKAYNAKIEALENIIDTQKQIIDNLTSAIKTLNGGV